MINQKVIQRRIEGARAELHRMEKQHGGMLHPRVIKQSMRLDELINKYHKEIHRL